MRFRPVSTPGPAIAGVPADRTAELAAELTPTLSQLDRTAVEAEAIGLAGRSEADRIRRDAARDADAITARADDLFERVRSRAAERRQELGRREADAVRAEGARAEAALRSRAAARIPFVADRLTDEVRRQLGLPGLRAGRPSGSEERGGGP
ncbi:hypothetical protein [Streptomyces sp. GS7]|uniref:hypothetical protein n=1 Tax=Streptomyces sp. GS7 TaxID=2692234 RepID=UPI0013182F2D|nr:hypothetical protein [Streptomyces sp. GS7]QHC23036.1 hypothetical protein GR130_18090 [Streptomyces sp. GS7]